MLANADQKIDRNRLEGGAMRVLGAVLSDRLNILRSAAREERNVLRAQRLAAERGRLEAALWGVRLTTNLAISRLGTIEPNVVNLSVRESVAKAALTFWEDLHRAYSSAYPSTVLGGLDVEGAFDRIALPCTVDSVCAAFQRRFDEIYKAWREAHACLRPHREDQV
jgi:hypothetical protein